MFNWNWLNKLKRILPDYNDDQNTRFFKILIYVVTGLLIFMILSCTLAFMITLKGAEEVLIPDVTGLKLEEALVAIQDRGLNSRIQLKYSSNLEDKGNVIEQSPHPGTVKKVGNQVILRVSKGAILDKIENYVGWHINDLEAHLKSLFNTYGTMLKINEPLVRITSSKPEGTILEQKPLPGTDLASGLTELFLVVSIGPEGKNLSVPDFLDLDFMSAMKKAASSNLPFLFTQRAAQKDEKKGVVVAQKPGKEENVLLGTIVQLTITSPSTPAGKKIFGILERMIPEQPVAVDTALHIISVDGVKEEVFRMKHKGGPLAIPYFEEEGTVLVISVLGKDQISFKVKR